MENVSQTSVEVSQKVTKKKQMSGVFPAQGCLRRLVLDQISMHAATLTAHAQCTP